MTDDIRASFGYHLRMYKRACTNKDWSEIYLRMGYIHGMLCGIRNYNRSTEKKLHVIWDKLYKKIHGIQ